MTGLAQEMVQRMVPVLKKAPVAKAYLFGSMARGEADERSDVDVLIDDPQFSLSLFELSGLIHDLTQACGRKVDVVPRDSVSRYIRDDIEEEKVLFYER